MQSFKNWAIRKLGGLTKEEAENDKAYWDRYAKALEDAIDAGNALVVTDTLKGQVIPKGKQVFLKANAKLLNCHLCDAKLYFRPDAKDILVEGCVFRVEESKAAIDIRF